MASAASNFLEAAILNQMLRATSYTWPTTLYFALLTDSNTASQRRAGTVTEVSTGTWTNYARTAVTAGTGTFGAAASDPRASTNSVAAVSFGTAATGSNVTVTALAVYDASTSGNLLYWCDLSSSQTVANGNVVSFATSSISISIT